jgi:hypothetical protein
MRIRIKESNQNDQLLNQLKSQMSSLLSNIEDTLEDKTQEQNESSLLTVASVAIAMPAILGLVAKFGRSASALVKKIKGSKPTDADDAKVWFEDLGKIADDLHHIYMRPLEAIIGKFVKDPTKAKKISHFLFHVIVGIMLLASGAGAVKALQSKEISMATLEAALSAIKGGEIKSYITKLLA